MTVRRPTRLRRISATARVFLWRPLKGGIYSTKRAIQTPHQYPHSTTTCPKPNNQTKCVHYSERVRTWELEQLVLLNLSSRLALKLWVWQTASRQGPRHRQPASDNKQSKRAYIVVFWAATRIYKDSFKIWTRTCNEISKKWNKKWARVWRDLRLSFTSIATSAAGG